MTKTKSRYLFSFWPVALAAGLIAAAALQTYRDGAPPRETLAVGQVTAELARTVSYGLVDADAPRPARAAPPAAAPGASST